MHADFVVSPDGKDTHPGTEAAPFATLERARLAVRALLSQGRDTDVVVACRGGVYALERPLVFDAHDGGGDGFGVTYAAWPGETPVLSGGRPVTGWERGADGVWRASLPEGMTACRQLFRDGERLARAFTPKSPGTLRVVKVSDDLREVTLNEAPCAGSLAGAELVVYNAWAVVRMPIVASDGARIVCSDPLGYVGHASCSVAEGRPVTIENAEAFLDQPGAWRFDPQARALYYRAAGGEDPNGHTFVAPATEQLLVVQGTRDTPVRRLRFEGLQFEHAAWELPPFGYRGTQAAHYGTTTSAPTHMPDAAVAVTHAADCAWHACAFRRLGPSALGLGAGCQRNLVTECVFDDIGGNGVMVGWRGGGALLEPGQQEGLAADWADPRDAPAANDIGNNRVSRCGAICHGAVGIFDAFSLATRIAHNEVFDLPYTGISIGFRWDETPTNQRRCRVEHNHIHDVMKVVADGGGIYTLGFQPGAELRGNHIHDVYRSDYTVTHAPNNGIFFDQGSSGLFVLDNVIYRTSGEPLRFNQTGPEKMTWGRNSLGTEPGQTGFPDEQARSAGPES